MATVVDLTPLWGIVIGGAIAAGGGMLTTIVQAHLADKQAERNERAAAAKWEREQAALEAQRERERIADTDAAAWRLVKAALDDLSHQTRILASSVKPGEEGLIGNAAVDPPDNGWINAFNRYSRVLTEVSFTNPDANMMLDEMRVAATRYATSSSMVAYLRRVDQEMVAYGVPPTGQWSEIQKEAAQYASDIDATQTRTNELIVRTVGFHRVYSAPFVEHEYLANRGEEPSAPTSQT